jgi:hypothetical protein
MSPHPSTERHPDAAGAPVPGSAPARDGRPPDWWHRDHPTFTALTGFFTGLAFVILVPGVVVGLLHALADDETAETLFPLVLVALVVPIALVVAPRTRRFGLYMAIGMVVTALVVAGVAALVLWVMIALEL